MKYKVENITLKNESVVDVVVDSDIDIKTQLDLKSTSKYRKDFDECDHYEQLNVINELKWNG